VPREGAASRTRVVAFGPGRVNLIGEHTDYAGGLSLPFAIEEGVTVTATAIAGGDVEAHAVDLGEEDSFPLADPGRDAAGWRAFVRGTAAELTASGHELRPARLEITGTVPEGSGLSSSAALEVALALALLALAGEDEPDRVALARLCSRVENDWVGANTGLLDQLAALLGEQGHALRIDFRSLRVTHVPLEIGDWRLVTVDSGEAHTHAGSGYNARRRECEEAARRLGLDSLRDAQEADLARLPVPLDRRVRHVLGENARVDATVDALREGDLARVGRLLDGSHTSMRDLYDASTAAVERTVAALKDVGAAGARMVGGGFGGHVLALFGPGDRPPHGARPVSPGPGARIVER
jgi:galactokinase